MEVDFSPLTEKEALSTKGGGRWVNSDWGWTYLLDEVTVYGEEPNRFEDFNNNVFGCPQCPTYDSGPGAAGDPYVEGSYRIGVAINHWLYH